VGCPPFHPPPFARSVSWTIFSTWCLRNIVLEDFLGLRLRLVPVKSVFFFLFATSVYLEGNFSFA